jgi:hypothetical protein
VSNIHKLFFLCLGLSVNYGPSGFIQSAPDAKLRQHEINNTLNAGIAESRDGFVAAGI